MNKESQTNIPELILEYHTSRIVFAEEEEEEARLVVSLKDITEIKRADEALRESNEKFHQLANNITDAFWIRSGDLRELYYLSPAYERIFGRSVESVFAAPQKWGDFIHPEDRKRVTSSFASLARDKSDIESEYRIVRPDGETRWVRARGFPVRDAAQIVIRYVGILTDITASKRTEWQLNIQYQISRVLAESATLKQASAGILRTICENMNWEVGEFWNLDSRAGVMRFDDMWIAPDIRADKFLRVSRKITPARGVGLPGQVWASGKPAWIPDVVVYANFLRAAEAKKAGLHSAFSFPILAGNEVIGAIEFFSREIRQPDEELMSMFAVLGLPLGQFFERKRADEAMRSSESRLRAIIDTEPECVNLLARDGAVLEMNPAGLRIMEADSLEQVANHNCFSLIAEHDHEAFRDLINRVFAGESGMREFQIVGLKGTHRWLDTHASPLRDARGDVTALLGITRDVTERKRSDEAMRESEEKYRTILENIEDGYFEVDVAGNFTFFNDSLCSIYGYPRDEMLGMNNRQYMDDENARKVYQTFNEVYRTGKPAKAFDWEIIRKDGTRRFIEASVSRKDDFAGQPIGFRGIVRDITERKQLEEQFRQSQKMEAIGVLAGGVAHDFNNLLTAINGHSDMTLKKMEADDPLRSHIKEIKDAGDRAAALTAQLLAFSRKQVLKPRVHNLNSIITDINRMLRRIIKESIEFRTVLDPELGNIKADPRQIEQVIMNLAVNARDAMPNGGTLTIETQNVYIDAEHESQHISVDPGPFVKMIVTDTGEGMTEETQRQIFEPFFTTKETGKGTGLGLSTVYGIVKQSGGHIRVHSEVGGGTIFEIYLPCVDEIAEKPKWVGDSEENYSGTETILLVEDEKIVRTLVSEILTSNGYHVLEAASGKAALSICDTYSEPIHMLLTDVIMPKMSGTELRDQAVKLRPDIKILFMSGYLDDSIIQSGVLDSDAAFIEKPFTLDGLAQKVREVLES